MAHLVARIAKAETRATAIVEIEPMVAWERVGHVHVPRAIKEYDRLGPERFVSEHGFAPTTTDELGWEDRRSGSVDSRHPRLARRGRAENLRLSYT